MESGRDDYDDDASVGGVHFTTATDLSARRHKAVIERAWAVTKGFLRQPCGCLLRRAQLSAGTGEAAASLFHGINTRWANGSSSIVTARCNASMPAHDIFLFAAAPVRYCTLGRRRVY